MRRAITEAIYNAALDNKKIYLLTGDLDHPMSRNFISNIPEQHINVGIAEQNMIGIAAGLALSGMKVFVISIVPFATMRCFEQIRNDICYQNIDVTIIGAGAGFSYSNSGVTHHSITDIAIMRALPNMRVISPCDPIEAKVLINKVIENKTGPLYIRTGRKKEDAIEEIISDNDIILGKGRIIRSGNFTTIFATGTIIKEALIASKILEEQGMSVEIINIHTIKPIDKELILNRCKNRVAFFTLEEHSIIGGLGSAVAEIISEIPGIIKPLFKRFGIEDKFTHSVGSQNFLREEHGISGSLLAERICKIV